MLTRLDRLLTGAIFIVLFAWFTQSLWKKLLPSWLYNTAETVGVLVALPVCVYTGGGVGAARVPLTSEPLDESMRLPPRSKHYYQQRYDNHHHRSPSGNFDARIPSKKATKRNVSETLKKLIAFRQKYLCDSCLIILPPSYEVDHIMSLADGGSNDPSNLRALCRDCHGWKSLNDRLRWNNEI